MQYKSIGYKIRSNLCFKMMPTAFLSLFLIITVAFLTGMCAMFPKKDVEIYDEGERVCKIHTVKSDYDEIFKEFLFSYDKSLGEKDFYTVKEDENGGEIHIKRGFDLDVNLFGKDEKIKVAKESNVSDVLKGLNVELKDDVYVNLDLETIVEPETKIDVTKVERKKENSKTIDFPYPVKNVFDDSLKKGSSYVKQRGVVGKKEIWVEKIYSNGKLIKEENKEEIIKPAVEGIVVIGNKKADENNSKGKDNEKKRSHSAPTARSTQPAGFAHDGIKNGIITINGVNYKIKNQLHGRATAYAARGRTARMGSARRGIVAANPKVLPYNTKVYIPGYGFAVVGDYCGAACKGKVLVDVCLGSIAECKAWGNKGVTVYVIE